MPNDHDDKLLSTMPMATAKRRAYSEELDGGRISLLVSLAAIGFSVTFGVAMGLAAGFRGGWVDNLIMRIADIQLTVPAILGYQGVTSEISTDGTDFWVSWLDIPTGLLAASRVAPNGVATPRSVIGVLTRHRARGAGPGAGSRRGLPGGRAHRASRALPRPSCST